MTESDSSGNAAQIEYWNAAAGETWVRFQEQLDRQTAPLGLEALREHPQLQSKTADAVRAALTKYATPQGVLMPAAVWIVLAHGSDAA